MGVTTTTARRSSQPRQPGDDYVAQGVNGAAWMKDANCKGVTTDIFFTEADELPSADAQFLCGLCLVKEECLQWAIVNDEEGYWGGTTKSQRDAIMSGRHRVKCPTCSSRDVVEIGRDTICIGCGLSW